MVDRRIGYVRVEERPQSPSGGQNNELGGDGLCDAAELHLGGEGLCGDNLGTVGSDDVLEGDDQEGEWQTMLVSVSFSEVSGNTHAMHSMTRKAIKVSGVTPPSAPASWFFARLSDVS
jgi:hypothetical protein